MARILFKFVAIHLDTKQKRNPRLSIARFLIKGLGSVVYTTLMVQLERIDWISERVSICGKRIEIHTYLRCLPQPLLRYSIAGGNRYSGRHGRPPVIDTRGLRNVV